ncbi:MAG: hypothetical protein Q6K26_00745 [Gloeomargarita sp. SZTDM-1c_bins_89]
MRRHHFVSTVLLATSLLTLGIRPGVAQVTIPRNPVLPRPRLPQPSLTCPDPAVQAINFKLLNRTSRFRGQVQIIGVVRNQGSAPYQSAPNQQIVALYEQVPGSPARLVAQQPFLNLAPGEQVQVIFERDWNSSSPAEGEFPPTYLVTINYDPDIYIDGNPGNDDCRTTNNRLERSGAAINTLF